MSVPKNRQRVDVQKVNKNVMSSCLLSDFSFLVSIDLPFFTFDIFNVAAIKARK